MKPSVSEDTAAEVAQAPVVAVLAPLASLVRRWRLILLSGIATAAIAVAATFVLPESYEARGRLIPEGREGALANLGSLGGLVGRITGGGVGGADLSPALVAELAISSVVLEDVARQDYPLPYGGRGNLAVFWGIDEDDPAVREYETSERLREAIETSIDGESGILTITASAGTAEVAYHITANVITAVDSLYITLRRARAEEELAFLTARGVELRGDLIEAEQELVGFRTKNRVITDSPLLVLEEARLQRSVNVASEVYLEALRQLEGARAEAARNTPVLSVVEPPRVPVKRSFPKRRITAVAALIGGWLLSVAWVLGQGYIVNARLQSSSSWRELEEAFREALPGHRSGREA